MLNLKVKALEETLKKKEEENADKQKIYDD